MLLGILSGMAGCGPDLEKVTNIDRGRGTTLIAFGDSITAGYGVTPEEAFPALLADDLGLDILNMGRNGDTTSSALDRLEEDVLNRAPWIVLVELGGNDFLNQRPREETERNLRTIITRIQAEGAVVVLLGMDLGLFVNEYGDLYASVARETGAFYVPEVNRGILDNKATRQEDRIHPNAAGHVKLAARIAEEVRPLVERARRSGGP